MSTTQNSNSTNGAGVGAKKPQYDPTFTDSVIAATGPKATPRMRQVMASMIRHVHDFARENDITVSEWMQGVEMLNWAGQMSNDRRNETQLLCDVIGLESLVDEITNKLLVGADYESTKSAILGPFFRKDTPPTENDASIIKTMPPDGEVTFMHGIVTDAATGAPIEGVKVDIWQCSTNGLYEQQDPDQAEFNLRGNFTTDKNGYYGLYCIRPVPYPVPFDGPAGKLLQLLDRHPYRPAHIHIMAGNDKYTPLVTQIFDRTTQYLENDSVFAVKDDLVVDFKTVTGNPKASLELEYNIRLAVAKS
ncbi:aromatic compound dioxygenase [Cryphonectria parasitica EP155]|uniref:Aromatic compound dioxygenase n=1 Tax=Cryphonectria parasitica (strain ATCC 38755 / EP155) TaxID=660469 RepID=A0A9P4XTP1_CRYP1|nr:aromatic compound dioxygenase [Cryphonectria parasitica EP155]KAF3760696.1 aromatic compound dioxygenase [Cryphonectria parasitica EP155]